MKNSTHKICLKKKYIKYVVITDYCNNFKTKHVKKAKINEGKWIIASSKERRESIYNREDNIQLACRSSSFSGYRDCGEESRMCHLVINVYICNNVWKQRKKEANAWQGILCSGRKNCKAICGGELETFVQLARYQSERKGSMSIEKEAKK